jgi:hypothetical protein
MKPPAPEIIDMDVEKLEALLRRAEDASLSPEDLQTVRTICESYLYLTNLIDQKSTTIAPARRTSRPMGRVPTNKPPNQLPPSSPLLRANQDTVAMAPMTIRAHIV